MQRYDTSFKGYRADALNVHLVPQCVTLLCWFDLTCSSAYLLWLLLLKHRRERRLLCKYSHLMTCISPLLKCSTHDDVGWLKNPTQYAIGANSSIQNANTDAIIHSVMLNLEENPDRRFI